MLQYAGTMGKFGDLATPRYVPFTLEIVATYDMLNSFISNDGLDDTPRGIESVGKNRSLMKDRIEELEAFSFQPNQGPVFSDIIHEMH